MTEKEMKVAKTLAFALEEAGWQIYRRYTICGRRHRNPEDANFCNICGKNVKPAIMHERHADEDLFKAFSAALKELNKDD